MNQPLTLVNPQNGELAFSIRPLTPTNSFDHLQRLNYFSCVWIQQGNGTYRSDFSEYSLVSNHMLFFAPYQPFILLPTEELTGVAIHFHPDFFCIIKHEKEVACNGILFNNIYQPPSIAIDANATASFTDILSKMQQELQQGGLAQYDLLIAYLKIFLITATRIKIDQHPQAKLDFADAKEPSVLQKLKDLIEENFRRRRSAGEYADMLNLSNKALGKITKHHFNKTITDLIQERIIIEAKRELYLTNKAVKEIAYELGFEDEYYFSRLFKSVTAISPQYYRETVGFGRAVSA